ncbi:PLC-like phosphodiesterase [Aulographum hederae CBS 113979]|uniref:glycerophosphodiester phosphodiesterase n=1 Tax=Aulographum hederae CBS 113979 TaxID=1176131 RepID=A0A6G1GPH4_9PEZI|nr:PLC-like phosphodiesterase [Aulographum hederae CBS 113979]
MPVLTTLVALSTAIGLASAIPTPWNGWGWPGHGGGGNGGGSSGINVQLGPRPFYLVDNMDAGPLKDKLESCSNGPFKTSPFSISHRGAPLMFPEHSKQGYKAAARMGAGTIECDVSFTSDRELVCRHSNCDLHYTTNILAIPELAAKCTKPFTPADPANGTAADAQCCTSDITLAEFKSLCALMEGDSSAFTAVNVTEYNGRLGPTPTWRTDMYATCAEPMGHKEYIQLVASMGLNFTAEAKTPVIPMPFQGTYTQADFAQQIIDEYREAGIPANRVWLQSFLQDDIFYWIDADPAFAAQAIYLDERADLSATGYEDAVASLPALAARGVKIMGPSTWQLVTADNATQTIVPSSYAKAAKEAGLELITWSLERSGPLKDGGGYYYEGVNNLINNDGDEYTLIDVLAREVGVTKMFSDWAGTVTYYANCFGL